MQSRPQNNLLFFLGLIIGIAFSYPSFSFSVDPGVVSKQLSQESTQNQPSEPDPQAPVIIFQNTPKQGPVTIDKKNKSRNTY